MENLENKCVCWGALEIQKEELNFYQDNDLYNIYLKYISKSNSENIVQNSENRQSLFKYNKELNSKIYIG